MAMGDVQYHTEKHEEEKAAQCPDDMSDGRFRGTAWAVRMSYLGVSRGPSTYTKKN